MAVYLNKRFRINSSCVYLLCMAFSDGLFLILHFFEGNYTLFGVLLIYIWLTESFKNLDTVRTFQDVYLNNNSNELHNGCKYMRTNNFENDFLSQYNWIKLLNITDRFDIICRSINYFRYLLRFVSAYIIVAFTIQRAYVVHSPLKDNFKVNHFFM